MITLAKLVKELPSNLVMETKVSQAIESIEIHSLELDSRKVQVKGLFVALRGEQADGHTYIEKTYDLQPSVIVCEEYPSTINENIAYLLVKNSHEAIAYIANSFYGNPSQKLKLVGITGTNGKTTTATLLYQLFQELGYTVGLLSTVENKINDEVIPATHTTLLEWPVSNHVRAEGVGFEPTRSVNPFRFSRPVPSATRRALHP